MKKTKILNCLVCGTPAIAGLNAKSILCEKHRRIRPDKFIKKEIVSEQNTQTFFEYHLNKSFPEITIPTLLDYPELGKVLAKRCELLRNS